MNRTRLACLKWRLNFLNLPFPGKYKAHSAKKKKKESLKNNIAVLKSFFLMCWELKRQTYYWGSQEYCALPSFLEVLLLAFQSKTADAILVSTNKTTKLFVWKNLNIGYLFCRFNAKRRDVLCLNKPGNTFICRTFFSFYTIFLNWSCQHIIA